MFAKCAHHLRPPAGLAGLPCSTPIPGVIAGRYVTDMIEGDLSLNRVK